MGLALEVALAPVRISGALRPILKVSRGSWVPRIRSLEEARI